jgi:hypothetical protein
MSTRNAVWRPGVLSAQPVLDDRSSSGEGNSEEKVMSAPVTTRRVAVFTLFMFTALLAATTGASAMTPDPPGSGTTGQTPAGASSGGPDLTVWLLAAVAVVLVAAIGVGIAKTLRHRHAQPPAVGLPAH